MASGAGDAASLAKTGGADDAAPPAKKDDEPVPAPFAWEDVPQADVFMPVLGVADDELWPELSHSAAAAKEKGKGKAPSSSSTAPYATKTKAPLLEQGAVGAQCPGASTRRHGDRTGSAAAVEPSPMHGPKLSRERRAAAPEQPPSHRNINNAGARGQQQQHGRFVQHPHGRGGGGGGWQRQENRGGFNGQPRGRGHQDNHRGPGHRPPMGYMDDHHGPAHRPLGPPPMGYIDAPHHMHPAPPFMGMVPPPMPYPYYYGMPYGYPEYFPGYFPPLQQGFLPPVMQYGALPQTHMMELNWNQQAGPSQTELQQHGQEHQAGPSQTDQPVQGQQTPPDQESQQTPEQLRQVIREQIEYYFSTENLDEDFYLRAQMDEEGWVPLTLIASFNKVCSTTTNMELILDSILPSTEVDIMDGKIRKRVGWERYTSVKSSSEAATHQ